MGNKIGYLGELEHLLLWTVLRLGDGAYGKAVRDDLEERSGRDVARGAVYITLDRMVKKGYLTSALADASEERGGRARRYFTVTDAGKEALRQARELMLSTWDGLEEAVEG